MTNILSLTDDQLALVKSLLEPSVTRDDETGELSYDPDETDPNAAVIMNQIDRLPAINLQRNRPCMFLSLYEVRRCYGGPEEGGWYYDFVECLWSELLTIPDMVTQWNEFVNYCAEEYGQVQTHDETTMLTEERLQTWLNDRLTHTLDDHDRLDPRVWYRPLKELHFTDDPRCAEGILAIEGIPGILADINRPRYS